MTQDTALAATIEERLFSVEGLPDERHRAFENDGFEPDNRFTESWMRVTHRFGGEAVRTLPTAGGRLDVQGFTQVDFYVALTKGRGPLDELTSATRAAFPGESSLSVDGLTLKVKSSRRWGGQRDGQWWWDHVDIIWTLRAVNPLA